jgi:hypothetical protein
MRQTELDALTRLALTPDLLADAIELLRNPLIGARYLIERVGNLAENAVLIAGHANRKITDPHGLKGMQQIVFEGGGAVDVFGGTVLEACIRGAACRRPICSGFKRLADRLHVCPSGNDHRASGRKVSLMGTFP